MDLVSQKWFLMILIYISLILLVGSWFLLVELFSTVPSSAFVRVHLDECLFSTYKQCDALEQSGKKYT